MRDLFKEKEVNLSLFQKGPRDNWPDYNYLNHHQEREMREKFGYPDNL